jgi:hypothetical protein
MLDLSLPTSSIFPELYVYIVNVIYEYGTLTISKENEEFFMAGPAVKVADNINFYE